MAAAPPWQWQADVLSTDGDARQRYNGQAHARMHTEKTGADEVAEAWKNVTNVVRDDWRPVDLLELLANSVRETQYSFLPTGWPSLLRARMPMLNEMPAMVLDRYNACQTVCFCGVFPELRRAWASVDNSLFLWRYDRWNDVPIEYTGEEQAICAVGLAKPKPHVFVAAIQHLLVVCTTVEVVLLGVCAAGATADSEQDLALQPLPLYATASDNVTMTCVCTTADGRIFLGGTDGHVYEVMYSATDSWRQKRCSKVCITGGLRQMLPPFLPSLLFGQPTPITQMVVDAQRHILYTASQSSAVQVFDLGADGKEAARRVVEITDFVAEASRAAGGRDSFGRTAERKAVGIARIAVVTPQESSRLHLLAVTTDGRRVYFSCFEARGASGKDALARPQTLRAEIVRGPVPQPGASTSGRTAATTGTTGAPSGRLTEVSCAAYGHGVLLLAEGSGAGRTRMIASARDVGVPPLGTVTGPQAAASGLREAVTELDINFPGDTCAIAPVAVESTTSVLPKTTGSTVLRMQDELRTQVLLPAPRFVLVSTAGVVEVEKLRPVDVLQALLEERSSSKVEAFFKTYSPPEAAAMAVQLAAAPATWVPAGVAASARAALDSTRLIGEPQPLEDTTNIMTQHEEAAAGVGTGSGFDMGSALPVPEPVWSASHKGVCLFASRLLHPCWETRLVQPAEKGSQVLVPCIGTDVLQNLEERLRALAAFLADYIAQRSSHRRSAASVHDPRALMVAGQMDSSLLLGGAQGPGAVKRRKLDAAFAQELKRDVGVLALARRAAEACFLLNVLSESNLTRLASRSSDSTRNRLAALKFRDLVSSAEGDAVAAQLISTLVSQHSTAAQGGTDDLADVLQRGCPSYFKEEDKQYYLATSLLQKAEGAVSPQEREALTKQAVVIMGKVPLCVDLAQVVTQLVFLHSFDSIVDLVVKKAAAMDPHGVAQNSGPEAESARQQRYDSCYAPLLAVLRWLIDPATAAANNGVAATALDAQTLSAEQRIQHKRTLLERANGAKDELFREVLYRCLAEAGATKDLLQLDCPSLQAFLTSSSGLQGSAGQTVGPLTQQQVRYGQLLSRLFVQRSEHSNAAAVYEALACRKSGAGENAVQLQERMETYQQAHLQAQSQGDAALNDRLAGLLKVLELQQRTLRQLERLLDAAGAGDLEENFSIDQLRADVAELRQQVVELAALYNDFAAKYKLWPLCLEIINLSGYSDAGYVRQLWDLHFRDLISKQGDADAALSAASSAVATLGRHFFPNQAALPLPHLCVRLEQLAAGLWPETSAAGAAEDSMAGSSAASLLEACRGQHESVVGCYAEVLSTRPGQPHSEALQAPVLRCRVLQGLLQACLDAKAAGLSRRLTGIVLEVVQRFASDAQRLPGRGAQRVAAAFEQLQQQLADDVAVW